MRLAASHMMIMHTIQIIPKKNRPMLLFCGLPGANNTAMKVTTVMTMQTTCHIARVTM